MTGEVSVLSYKVVCFDLDGTLAEGTWPEATIGAPIPEGVELLCHYADDGYGVIVYTSRPESHKSAIWHWLEENLPGRVYDVICNKPLAGLYVDDRAMRFERAPVEKPVQQPDPRRFETNEDVSRRLSEAERDAEKEGWEVVG